MGHEAIGVVEAVGTDVGRIKPSQVVVMPFAFSDGSCLFCEEGLHTACTHGGFWQRLGLRHGCGGRRGSVGSAAHSPG